MSTLAFVALITNTVNVGPVNFIDAMPSFPLLRRGRRHARFENLSNAFAGAFSGGDGFKLIERSGPIVFTLDRARGAKEKNPTYG